MPQNNSFFTVAWLLGEPLPDPSAHSKIASVLGMQVLDEIGRIIQRNEIPGNPLKSRVSGENSHGECGIRTHVPKTGQPHFECGSL